MRSYRLEEKIKMLINYYLYKWLYKSQEYIVFNLF